MTDNEILKIRELSREAIDVVFSNRTPFKDPDKAKAICERRLSGALYKDIADEFCISICRCRDYVENTMRLYRVMLRRKKETEKTKFKPCPFCGATPIFYSYDPFDGYQGNNTMYAVACLKCSARISENTAEKAKEVWNRRADNEQREAE